MIAKKDTICAISTPAGKGGIGIVRISGEEAFSLADQLFLPHSKKKYTKKDNRKLRYGTIVHDNKVLDEALVAYMESPYTYTRENIVEMQCHGGYISTQRIMSALLELGCRLAEPGEFTQRAFLNGRLDLTAAEAVMDIIDSTTMKSHEQAIRQLSGELAGTIHALQEDMLEILSLIEYSINFMEDAQEEFAPDPIIQKAEVLLEKMQTMLERSKSGRLIREGIHTVIAGRPNVGKSSLLNAFLDENRAIVTDIPGTTRDTIEEGYILDGVALRLVDTAGIRDTEDVVEKMGVERSRKLMDEADLILVLLDLSAESTDDDAVLFEAASEKPGIFLFNKTDLSATQSALRFEEEMQRQFPHIPQIRISTVTGEGLDELRKTIKDLFFTGEITSEDPMLTNLRQTNLMKRAKESLAEGLMALKDGMYPDACEVDFREAYMKLKEITGENLEEDVLDRIFSDFCIGK